jgi:hypothetical protein
MNEIIRQAKIEDAEVIAAIVREANKDVAQRFNLNRENAPKHPSFCNAAWVKADFQRRAVYFSHIIAELHDKQTLLSIVRTTVRQSPLHGL